MSAAATQQTKRERESEMAQTEQDTAAAWGDYGNHESMSAVVRMATDEIATVDRVLAQNDRRMAALRMCEWELEGYPHPGCAEFGPPDVFTCGALATHRAVVQSPWVHPEDSSECEFPGDTHPDLGIVLSCAEHLSDLVVDDPFSTLLYVECIATGERVDVERVAVGA